MNTKSNLTTIIFVAVVALIAVVALAIGNPHSLSWPIKCPLHWFTGYQCPLCGVQRACHELLHGNIKEAWTLNPSLFFLMPYLLVIIIGQVLPSLRNKNRVVSFCYSDRSIAVVLIAMIIWGIVRNV